jgi:hypothetical protein
LKLVITGPASAGEPFVKFVHVPDGHVGSAIAALVDNKTTASPSPNVRNIGTPFNLDSKLRRPAGDTAKHSRARWRGSQMQCGEDADATLYALSNYTANHFALAMIALT